jgi:hypothetical protein
MRRLWDIDSGSLMPGAGDRHVPIDEGIADRCPPRRVDSIATRDLTLALGLYDLCRGSPSRSICLLRTLARFSVAPVQLLWYAVPSRHCEASAEASFEGGFFRDHFTMST